METQQPNPLVLALPAMSGVSTGGDNSSATAADDNEDVTVVSDLKKRKRIKGAEEKNVKESLVFDVVSSVAGDMGKFAVGTDVSYGGMLS
jgi:hypothetical protein